MSLKYCDIPGYTVEHPPHIWVRMKTATPGSEWPRGWRIFQKIILSGAVGFGIPLTIWFYHYFLMLIMHQTTRYRSMQILEINKTNANHPKQIVRHRPLREISWTYLKQSGFILESRSQTRLLLTNIAHSNPCISGARGDYFLSDTPRSTERRVQSLQFAQWAIWRVTCVFIRCWRRGWSWWWWWWSSSGAYQCDGQWFPISNKTK